MWINNMTQLLSEECIANILGHIKNSWNYDYPTGKTLEKAIFRGIEPFYANAKSLGSPSTIVDVGKDNQAFDIKGCKVLGHVNKTGKSSNHEKNIFVEQNVPEKGKIKVRIPQSIITQVRRPKVDLKNYAGDAKKSLNEQVNDYHEFALKTTNKDGYKELFSIVLLYGIDKGFKSVFLTIKKFDIPAIENYSIETKKNGTPCAYHGKDINDNVVFSLSSFNKGSSNFYKRFYTEHGHLMTWPAEEDTHVIFKRESLELNCAINKVE
jgi:hypothetical protein